MSDDYSHEDLGFEPEEEFADYILAHSTMTMVRSVMQFQEVSELSYQNFQMSQLEDGYSVSDKMTGELLLMTDVEKDVIVNQISPYASQVLLDACSERFDELRLEAAIQKAQSQLEGSDGFALIIENLGTEVPIVDFEADGPGIEEDIEL